MQASESVFSSMVLPPLFFEELIASYQVKGVISCTAGQADLEEACVTSMIPCLSLSLTEAHALEVEKKLSARILEMMRDPCLRGSLGAFKRGS
eukprot:780320-Amphidinium_carterae.1